MVYSIKKLFIVFICFALVACARAPKVIDEETLSFSIAEDITQLEIDASLKNIDLHTAIAIAVRNNRDLRISVMESALSPSQRDLQKFDMLPDIALNAGYSEFTELQPSTSVSVDRDTDPAPDLDGTQFGFGINNEFGNGMFIRAEGSYMTFDGASLSSNDNKITLSNLDGLTGKLAIGKSF